MRCKHCGVIRKRHPIAIYAGDHAFEAEATPTPEPDNYSPLYEMLNNRKSPEAPQPATDKEAVKAHKITTPNGELDEVFVSGASVHVERLNEMCFWIGIDHPTLPSLNIRTGVEDRKWFFRLEEDSKATREFVIERTLANPPIAKPEEPVSEQVELPELDETCSQVIERNRLIRMGSAWNERAVLECRERQLLAALQDNATLRSCKTTYDVNLSTLKHNHEIEMQELLQELRALAEAQIDNATLRKRVEELEKKR